MMSVRKLYEGQPFYKVANGYHVEVEGCIVNIRVGLKDIKNRNVTSIEIIPDKYAGEPKWKVTPKVHNIRVIKLKG